MTQQQKGNLVRKWAKDLNRHLSKEDAPVASRHVRRCSQKGHEWSGKAKCSQMHRDGCQQGEKRDAPEGAQEPEYSHASGGDVNIVQPDCLVNKTKERQEMSILPLWVCVASSVNSAAAKRPLSGACPCPFLGVASKQINKS